MKPSDVALLLDDLLTGADTQEVLASRLAAVRMDDIDGACLAAGVNRLHARAILVPDCDDAVDIVGTGGGSFRRAGALNISTVSALVLASSGVRVCKQGNRKASSTSGSSDVLEALGIPVGLGPAEVRSCLAETNFGYCFAPRFHPGLGALAPIRRSLGHPTLLNWLAPLANPAQPRFVQLGVHDLQLGRLMAGALLELGVRRATVVCGPNGLDELSVVSPSVLFTVSGTTGDITEQVVVPQDEFGVDFTAEPVGGDTSWNLKLAEQALRGLAPPPYRETLQANVALALYTVGTEPVLAKAWTSAGDLIAADMTAWFERTRDFHRSLISAAEQAATTA